MVEVCEVHMIGILKMSDWSCVITDFQKEKSVLYAESVDWWLGGIWWLHMCLLICSVLTWGCSSTTVVSRMAGHSQADTISFERANKTLVGKTVFITEKNGNAFEARCETLSADSCVLNFPYQRGQIRRGSKDIYQMVKKDHLAGLLSGLLLGTLGGGLLGGAISATDHSDGEMGGLRIIPVLGGAGLGALAGGIFGGIVGNDFRYRIADPDTSIGIRNDSFSNDAK